MTTTAVIADIHGMFCKLEEALSKINTDKVIFTGDYIDRGPESAKVVAKVKELVESGRAIALRGNHEEFMYESFTVEGEYSSSYWWLSNGGVETIESYKSDHTDYLNVMAYHANWMRNLPIYHEDEYRIYVHGYAPEIPVAEFTTREVLWGRYDRSENYPWFGKHIVHGHTPVKVPTLHTHRTNLDTGAVFGRPLTVGIFDDSKAGGPVELIEV